MGTSLFGVLTMRFFRINRYQPRRYFLTVTRRLFCGCGLICAMLLAMPVAMAAPTEAQLKSLEDAWSHIVYSTRIIFSDEAWLEFHRKNPYIRAHIMAYVYTVVGEAPADQFLFYGHLSPKNKTTRPTFRSTQKAVYIHVESQKKYVLHTKQGGSARNISEIVPLESYASNVGTLWHFETTQVNVSRILDGRSIGWNGNQRKKTSPITADSPVKAAQVYEASGGPLAGIPHDWTLPGASLNPLSHAEKSVIITNLRRMMLLWEHLYTIAFLGVQGTPASHLKNWKSTIQGYSEEKVTSEYNRVQANLPKRLGSALPPGCETQP